jgi:hypothetical protein
MPRTARAPKNLEVHRHSFISGPRAYWAFPHPSREVVHSHEGGDTPHEHPDTGPACYTIDKDDWFRTTGLRGGGRKKFTARPSGEQLPLIPREPMTFDVIFHEPSAPPEYAAEGPGLALPARIVLTFKSRANFKRA